MSEPLQGHVARIVSDEELIINIGENAGVKINMIFDVVDERLRDVVDPVSGRLLGSIDRAKARVYVTEVGPNLALAAPFGRQRSPLLSIGGSSKSRSLLSGPEWPEGVSVGDELVHKGKFRRTDRT